MNKKRIAQYCCAALVAAGIGLNIQNALADYGIGENSLSLVATGGDGSSASSSSSSSSVKYTCVSSLVSKKQDWKTTSFRSKVGGVYYFIGMVVDGWYYHKYMSTTYIYGRSCVARKDAVLTKPECEAECKGDAGASNASN